MPYVDDFSEEAKLAYQAYLDMNNSKAAHFNCLKAIESIYESGGVPSHEENLEMKKLLANHDKNVTAFKTAMAAVTNADEKHSLVRLMS